MTANNKTWLHGFNKRDPGVDKRQIDYLSSFNNSFERVCQNINSLSLAY